MSNVIKIIDGIAEIVNSTNIFIKDSEINLKYSLNDKDFYEIKNKLVPTLIIENDKFVIDYSNHESKLFVEFIKI